MKTLKKSILLTIVVLSITMLFSVSSFAQDQQSNNTAETKSSKYIAYVYKDDGSVAENKVVSTIQEGDDWIKDKGLRGMICLESDPKAVVGIELEGTAIDFTPKTKYVISMKYYKSKYDKRVLAIQKALNYLGYKIKEDGYYGKNTCSAVEKFQKEQHLKADGIIGKSTFEYLAHSAKTKKN